MSIEHPIRKHAVHVWQAPEGQPGPRWIARFGDGTAFPINFSGATESEARARAEAFRADVIAKNEAAFINRMEGIEKARLAREKKKAGSA